MANKVVVEIDINTGEATKNIEDLTDSIEEVKTSTEDAGSSFSELGGVVDGVSGGMVSGFTKGIGAIRAATKGMKLLKVAFASTGIGLLVVAVSSLVAYFTSTEEGAKKLQTVMTFFEVIFSKITSLIAPMGEAIMAAFNNPKEAVLSLWEMIKENIMNRIDGLINGFKALGTVLEGVFTLDWDLIKEGAGNYVDAALQFATGVEDVIGKVTEGVSNLMEEVVAETKKALDIAQRYIDSQFRTRDLIQKLTVDNAKLSATIDEQQKKIDDTTRSFEDRKEALRLQSEASAQLAKNIAIQAQAEESLLRQQIAITSGVEKREELETQLAEKIAQRIEAEKQVNIVNLENAQKTREIDREEFDRKRTILQQLTDLRLEANTNEQEVELERLKLAEENALTELDLLRATEEEKQQVKDYYAQITANKKAEYQKKEDEVKAAKDAKDKAEAQKKIDDELAKEKELSDAKLALTKSTFGAMSSLAEAFAGDSEGSARRQFKISKALSIAEATQNTFTGITTALAAKGADGLLPFPVRLANAAIAGAMGLAQVKKIASTKLGNTTPSSSVGGGGVAGGGSPVTTPTLDTSALNTEPQQNIQAYVLDKTITQTQAQNQKIEEQANLVL
tara:strand:+ start:5534 stop:7396 length:1863 start_codon:yes stop_codon:yes gene_type:complete